VRGRETDEPDVDHLENAARLRIRVEEGRDVRGRLSPFDDQSDYIRVNPMPTHDSLGGKSQEESISVAMHHVVTVQKVSD
jgi:hypothetical protein